MSKRAPAIASLVAIGWLHIVACSGGSNTVGPTPGAPADAAADRSDAAKDVSELWDASQDPPATESEAEVSVESGIDAPLTPPNIVFILADDLGWRDTSTYGSAFYETPNIQRLADRGMRFTQAYAASPLCSPTRASILTGMHPARIGITLPVCHKNEQILEETPSKVAPCFYRSAGCTSATRLALSYVTLAEALKEGGYHTGHYGKWHLGQDPFNATNQGFDDNVPYHYSGPTSPTPGNYFEPWSAMDASTDGEHVEDHMAQAAIQFLKDHKNKRFFLNYWAFSVHSPWQGKQALIKKYDDKAKTLPASSPQRHPVYGAMVHTLDANIGKLLDTIDSLGIAENTLIVFFSDNGGVHWKQEGGDKNYWEAGSPYDDIPITSNAPLRGGKATVYEGGTREPLIVVWPGKVAAGSQNGSLVQSTDFYPTLLEAAGLSPKPGQAVDGVSFLPVLLGTGPSQRKEVFCHFPHGIAKVDTVASAYVRQGEWKLIRFFQDAPNGNNRHELYNLKDDPKETTNLLASQPEKSEELRTRLNEWLANVGACVPNANPSFDASCEPPEEDEE